MDMQPTRKRLVLALIIGFFAGVLWLVTVRFLTYKPDITHFHANFAVYVNGERDPFTNFTFYEEVQSCGDDGPENPKTRAHMHDNVSHAVHVHDAGSTWGHFFANLGYTLGNDVLKTSKGVFVNGQDDKKLRFFLNGQETNSIANQPIKSEDRLLVDYGGTNTEQLKGRYDGIEADAGELNTKSDPAACSGSKPLTFGERLKHAFGFSE